MSLIDMAVHRESHAESMPELVAGLAVVVLTVLGLAKVSPNFLVAIATIIFGVGLLLYGTATLAMLNQASARLSTSGAPIGAPSGLSTVVLAGAAGIILGVLALLGISAMPVIAAAVIAFGGALLISSNAAARVKLMSEIPANADPAIERFVRETASDNEGLQTMTGLAAVVLGILALAGLASLTLLLVALLALGCFASLTSTFLTSSLTSAFQTGARASSA